MNELEEKLEDLGEESPMFVAAVVTTQLHSAQRTVQETTLAHAQLDLGKGAEKNAAKVWSFTKPGGGGLRG